jgi:hypothetical protein
LWCLIDKSIHHIGLLAMDEFVWLAEGKRKKLRSSGQPTQEAYLFFFKNNHTKSTDES